LTAGLASTRVLLVRHAESAWSPDEMRPLSARGFAQAACVADALSPWRPQAIYSSPYSRARQTIEPFAARAGLPIETVDDLRERRLAVSGAAAFERAARAAWDDVVHAPPGSESNREAQRRGVAALETLIERHRGGVIVVATHGTLLALMLNHFDARFDHAFWRAMPVPAVYATEFGDGGRARIGPVAIPEPQQ
jgi:2,3-bisphosphoglycerate-dependent phosphoglycerate mutase